jgi:hypothetical protein
MGVNAAFLSPQPVLPPPGGGTLTYPCEPARGRKNLCYSQPSGKGQVRGYGYT